MALARAADSGHIELLEGGGNKGDRLAGDAVRSAHFCVDVLLVGRPCQILVPLLVALW